MAEKTRRAYGVDLAQLGEWAAGRELHPKDISHRDLRRFAAVLGEHGSAKSTVARKLAAIRTFYRHLVERGELEANPADLVSSPKKDAYLPQVLKSDEVAELLERIPATTPLDLRDRAMFELAYAAGLRAEELTLLDTTSADPDGEQVRVEGKGGRTRVVPVGRARLARAGPLPEPRPGRARRGREQRAVPVEERQAPVHVGRAAAAQAPGPPRGHLAAHPAALLRHPPARGRRGPAHDPGAPGPCVHQHDPDLHSGRVEAPQDGLCALSPARVTAMETNLKAIELRDLWRRYKDDRDEKARERLVLAYAPLVKYVAGRMSSGLPSHVEESDLISYGLLGLISAIERFEPEREIKFETFAITRIKGSIIDELRSLDWVPRSVRTKAREIEKANAKLEHQLHRAPTDQEMAIGART